MSGRLFILLILFLAGCQLQNEEDDFSHIGDQDVKRILKRAFDSAGTLKSYRDIESIRYRKKTILYNEDGSIESSVDQIHEMRLSPSLTGSIIWTDSTGNRMIYHSQSESYTKLNDQIVPNTSESAKQSFFSNYFVLFIPFKLLDTGVQLTFEGTTELASNARADIIKAVYSPEQYDNHSTSDEWYFFFDSTTGRVLANLVYHEPTYAFIENIETTEEFPIRMNVYRKTWRTDKDRNKQYLRGEFWYSDYEFESKNE